MRVKEAIEIKSRTGEEFLNSSLDELEEADRLSIEALKRLQDIRHTIYSDLQSLLPGETVEEK